MKYIIGLNAIGFNTSATLIKNGKILAAVEEERLSREKRTRKFPTLSIKYLLKRYNLKIGDISAICISWNPLINLEKFSPFNSNDLSYIPNVLHAIPGHLQKISKISNFDYFEQNIYLSKKKNLKIFYIKHHLCHASNFFVSPFSSASIMTVDAFGEKQSIGFYEGNKNKIKEIWTQEFPHSLGSFYSAFTQLCGFTPQNDEWKLMGAASYGNKQRYYKKIKNLINFLPNSGFEIKLKYFNHYLFHRPDYFNKLLLNYLRLDKNSSENLDKKYYDIACAAQSTFEDIYFHLINSLYKKKANQNLVISGGSALNCLANGKVTEKTKFKNLFVPPVPDDSGAGLGAANYCFNVILNKSKRYTLKSNYLGPSFSNDQIKKTLKKYKIRFEYLKKPEKIAAKSISEQKIIGWFQDGIEFGDRALGNRSILADPRQKNMKDRVNMSVKYREKFRPFAPSILFEKTKDYFLNPQSSFFMEKTLRIRKSKQILIPAITHKDGTGRLQTVKKENNSKFYDLINEFYKITGIPLVLNTSLNYKGEPIVCTPDDAIKTFFLSGLDELYLGNYKIKK